MNAPQTLTRPLAARIAALPDPVDQPANRDVSLGVAAAAAQAMTDGHTHYTDRPGILPLRSQVVGTLGAQYGLEMGADEVTITCGAIEGRFVILKQLTKAGNKILTAGAGTELAAAAHLVGASLTDSASDAGITLLYLTPADDAARRTAFLELAAQHGWWIIWDMGTTPDAGDFHPAQNPALAAKTITIGEVAELPGWRVGWLAGSSAANKLRAFKQSMTICTTSVSQWAALGLKGT